MRLVLQLLLCVSLGFIGGNVVLSVVGCSFGCVRVFLSWLGVVKLNWVMYCPPRTSSRRYFRFSGRDALHVIMRESRICINPLPFIIILSIFFSSQRPGKDSLNIRMLHCSRVSN